MLKIKVLMIFVVLVSTGNFGNHGSLKAGCHRQRIVRQKVIVQQQIVKQVIVPQYQLVAPVVVNPYYFSYNAYVQPQPIFAAVSSQQPQQHQPPENNDVNYQSENQKENEFVTRKEFKVFTNQVMAAIKTLGADVPDGYGDENGNGNSDGGGTNGNGGNEAPPPPSDGSSNLPDRQEIAQLLSRSCASCHTDGSLKNNEYPLFFGTDLADNLDYFKIFGKIISNEMPPKDSNAPPITPEESAKILMYANALGRERQTNSDPDVENY